MDANMSLLARIETFEDYCNQKRSLEGDIEQALARRDEKAIEDLDTAQRELESTKRECAEIEARMENARCGNFSTSKKTEVTPNGAPGAPEFTAEEHRPPIGTPQSPVAQLTRPRPDVTIPPATLPLIPASTADSRSYSVISSPEQSTTGSGNKSLDAPEDHMSEDFMNSLVQRYADLCHERRTLQEGIKEKLERKERIAAEKLVCARITLDTTRRNAVEIVAALMEASGGDTHIRLPHADESDNQTGSAHPSKVPGLDYPLHFIPSPTGYSRASTGASTPPPIFIVVEKNAPEATPAPAPASLGTPPSLALHLDLAAATTGLPQSISNPASTSKPIISTSQPAKVQPTKVQPTKVQPTKVQPVKVEAWEAEIFRLYDDLMPKAIAARSSVTVSHLPWPVLEFKHDIYSPDTIFNDDIKQDAVADFVRTYSVWKGCSFQAGRDKMRSDWESVEKVFPSKRDGRKRVEKAVRCLAGAV
jgi:hypothetical protein